MPSNTINISSSSSIKNNDSQDSEVNSFYLLREKLIHIIKAAKSATLANILAPLLCIPAFKDEVTALNLGAWLAYMAVSIVVRTWIIFTLPITPEKIIHPELDLKKASFALSIVGFGWGLGWFLMAADLTIVNRMIYIYMITAALIAGMYAYSVHKPTFYLFTLPIMIPALCTSLWLTDIFPWTFVIGLATVFIAFLSIARNFASTFDQSIRLRFRNESLFQELAAERDQSIAANISKSKFIADASHDLRQPLQAVNVYLEMIQFDNLATAEKKILSKIKNCITILNVMFDSLLNISKFDADVTHVKNSFFQLKDLGDAIVELSESPATRKGLKLELICPDLIVKGDKIFLQQIVTNLVSNAIQYTESGTVGIRFEIDQDCLVFHVSDTGCGIYEAEQGKIFNEFFRSDRTRKLHDGLGLGLAIVKRMCHLIGAEVSVVSKINTGSCFTVKTVFIASLNERQTPHSEPILCSTDVQDIFQGKHIAVIEDNAIIAEAYRQTLASKGAYVYVLSEFELELVTQLQSIDHLDCIICDYRLRQTTGDLLIEKIRENFNKVIPAIIVTADTSPSHIHFFDQIDVQVLHKPISFEQVTKTIEKLLSQNE